MGQVGAIEGICGPMFSEKTTELLRRLRRHEIAGRSVVLFKPDIDNRYGTVDEVVTHDGGRRPAIPVGTGTAGVMDLFETAQRLGADVVGIDEIQFFAGEIFQAIRTLQDEGTIVVWSGLDMDSNGVPFGAVPQLMAVGSVTKLTAVCSCGADATHTHRRPGVGGNQVLVGAADRYSAMCFNCWRAAFAEPCDD